MNTTTKTNNKNNLSSSKNPLLTEQEVYELLKELPSVPLDTTILEGSIIDVEKEIQRYNYQQVSSYYIYEPGTNEFHSEGLFSEKIFGSLISMDRFQRCGYIDLHTEIIQPVIYFILNSLKTLYTKIFNGSTYAIFNNQTKDFEISSPDNPKAKTGYQYFIEHIYQLTPPKSPSQKKEGYRKVFLKFQKKKLLTMSKLLVLPAGLREITQDTKKLARDTINQMYLNVLSLSNSVDPQVSTEPIYDRVRSMIQSKIMDIWNYIMNIIKDDNGFVLDKFGDRNISFGTGNVLAIDIKQASSPDDPANLKPNEVNLSLVQAIKAYQPIMIHLLKSSFSYYFNPSSNIATLINPKTLQLTSISIPNKIVKYYTDEDKLEYYINSLQYTSFKISPISITIGKDQYYIRMVYDMNKVIFTFNDITILKSYLKKQGIDFDSNKIRPITWSEFIYILGYTNIEHSMDEGSNYGMTTRYPAVQPESIRPFHPKICSTIPYRSVVLIDVKDIDTNVQIYLPQYPILQNKFFEAMSINALTMSQFGADTDGDILSYTGLYTKESKKEIDLYYKTFRSILTDDGGFQYQIKDTHDIMIRILSQ